MFNRAISFFMLLGIRIAIEAMNPSSLSRLSLTECITSCQYTLDECATKFRTCDFVYSHSLKAVNPGVRLQGALNAKIRVSPLTLHPLPHGERGYYSGDAREEAGIAVLGRLGEDPVHHFFGVFDGDLPDQALDARNGGRRD